MGALPHVLEKSSGGLHNPYALERLCEFNMLSIQLSATGICFKYGVCNYIYFWFRTMKCPNIK